MLSKTALFCITIYQRWISPHKGYRCAHSVLHGGTGCSGYVKHAIHDEGLWQAWPAIKQRFRACKAASETLRANCVFHAQPLDEDERAELERRRREDPNYKKDRCCSCSDCAGAACVATPTRSAPQKVCDTNPCDGDGCGLNCCGGCDCTPSCS